MPKKNRSAAQRAASRRNLEAARRTAHRKGNAILSGSAISKHQARKADLHMKKGDAIDKILAGKKPRGKRATKRIYG